MAAAKKSNAKPAEKQADVVLVPFAYATAKGGEVVQLVKGDVVNPDRFEAKSIEHLRSIGFVGSDN
jgi:hypothetical protein